MRKLRDAGKLGPGRTVAVTGIGGLGSYAIQYAKLLGGGATVVAFARKDSKLNVAKENGANHGINVKDKSTEAIQDELERLTGRRTVHAILDCVGSEASISMGFDLLGPEGALAAVGLMSQRVEHRQFPFVGTELTYLGFLLGQPPGPRRSPLARRSRPRQTQRHQSQTGGHQREPGRPGPG
ncbi:zinc-binding dehydrogenase [Streptomyces sp. NPDC005506]|uniref:zinc-binding dehydrogenase n=1 Tax=unclassified Streptomyces TaxID=2593676 RepID=UPI0036BF59B8